MSVLRNPRWLLFSAVCLCAIVLAPCFAYGFEPVTALDDGFATPGIGSAAESAAVFPGIESLIGHPFAVLAWQEPFGIRELAVTTIHAGTGFGRFGVSAGFSGSGFDLYGEEQLKAGLSYAPLDNLGIGVRATRTAVRISGFGDASAFSIDVGAVYRPIESLWIAFTAEDLAGAELGESREPLDGSMRLSATWQAIDRVTFIAAFRDTPRFDPSLAAGFTVQAAGPLTIGAIGGSEPDRIELLTGITFAGLRFCWRGSYHSDLGMSHGCSLVWGE